MGGSEDDTPTVRDSTSETFAFDDGAATRPTDPPEETEPERYGPPDLLGEGGLGKVFLVHDRILGRSVAKKVLKHRVSAAGHNRFRRESKVTAQLEHPSIIPVYDSGTGPEGEPFYTMKHVRGRSLADCIDEALSPDARLEWVDALVSVSDAIAYAHSRGIVHRDLKPENIMVGEFGECLVLDWGLATPTLDWDEDTAEAPSLDLADSFRSRVGRISGTPAYMAPEQALGKAPAPAADVFALGAILYEILTGEAPYAYVDGIERTLKAAAASQWRPVRDVERTAPAELVAIAERALSTDPDDRYPTAKAFGDDLRRWIRGQRVAAYRYGPLELLMRFVRQNAGYLGIAGIAAAVCVALVIAGVTSTLVTLSAGYTSTRSALADANLLLATKALSSNEVTTARSLARDVLAVREDPDARGILSATSGVAHLEPVQTVATPCDAIEASTAGLLCLRDQTLTLLGPDARQPRWTAPSGMRIDAVSTTHVVAVDGTRNALLVHDLVDGRIVRTHEERSSAVFEPDGTLRTYARGAAERHPPTGPEPVSTYASLPIHWNGFDGGDVLVTVSGQLRRSIGDAPVETLRAPVSPVSGAFVHDAELWVYGDGIARYPTDLSGPPTVLETGGRLYDLQRMGAYSVGRRNTGNLWVHDANGMVVEMRTSARSFTVVDATELWTTDGETLTRWRMTDGRSRGLGTRGKATMIAASPDEQWLATCHYDQPTRVYAYPSLGLVWSSEVMTPLCTWSGSNTLHIYEMDAGSSRTSGVRHEWTPTGTRTSAGPPDLLAHIMVEGLFVDTVATELYDEGGQPIPQPEGARFVEPDRMWADGMLTDLAGTPIRPASTPPTYASERWTLVEGTLQHAPSGQDCAVQPVRQVAENDALIVLAHTDDTVAVHRSADIEAGRCTPIAHLPGARDRVYALDVTASHILVASWTGEALVYAIDALVEPTR